MWNFDIEERKEIIESLNNKIKNCEKCNLCYNRKNAVTGEGSLEAKIMIIGESPSEDDNNTGRPFVGKQGIFLNKMLEFMKFSRNKVYLTNLVKCKTNENKNPNESEIKSCSNFLEYQFKAIEPRIIITLGMIPTQYMIGYTNKKLSLIIEEDEYFIKNKGDWKYCVIPFYSLSYLIKNKDIIKKSTENLKERISKTNKLF